MNAMKLSLVFELQSTAENGTSCVWLSRLINLSDSHKIFLLAHLALAFSAVVVQILAAV